MKAKKFRFGGISLPTKRQGEDTPGVSPRELHSSSLRFAGFLLGNFLLAPTAGALTSGDSALRSLPTGLFLLVFSVYGLAAITRISDRPLRRLFLAAIYLVLCGQIAAYLYHYFTVYPAVSAGAFESYDFKGALQTASARRPEKIIVSSRVLGPAALPNFYRLFIPTYGIPVVVGEPVAADNVCIINNPYSEEILNPNRLIPRLSDKTNFTKLLCF